MRTKTRSVRVTWAEEGEILRDTLKPAGVFCSACGGGQTWTNGDVVVCVDCGTLLVIQHTRVVDSEDKDWAGIALRQIRRKYPTAGDKADV